MKIRYVLCWLGLVGLVAAGVPACGPSGSTNNNNTQDGGAETIAEGSNNDGGNSEGVVEKDAPEPGPGAPTFAKDIKPIFAKYSCAQGGCHGSTQSGGLELTDGNAYNNLVNQKSTSGAWTRVVPGDPDKSLLVEKVSKASPAEGSRMPLVGGPMKDAEIKTITDWVKAGAAP